MSGTGAIGVDVPPDRDRRAFNKASIAAITATLTSRVASAAPDGQDVVTLEARPGTLTLRAGPATAIWGYNGQVPGPLLRVKKGEEVRVRLVNGLAQPTTLTWHGVRNVNAMDGVGGLTQKPVMPGETFEYRFTPPDAGLYWYHPGVRPFVAAQESRGLYGVLIVDEAEPPKVDADVLVVLDDWTLDEKAQVLEPGSSTEHRAGLGRTGALMMVNGKPVPATTTLVPGARVRLRLLNACATRICVVGLPNLNPMVVAIDGQPSELFAPMHETVPLGPGARFELMLDLPTAAGKDAALVLRGDGEPDIVLMILLTRGAASAPRPAVAKLPNNPLLPSRIPLERSLRREIVIGGDASQTSSNAKRQEAMRTPPRWSLNGVVSDGFSGKPLFVQKRGGPVTLTFNNKTAVAQQIHIHGHVWRLLHDLDDGWDPYWRDSVLLAPGKTKHVAFIADNPGRWAIGSSVLDRQDAGLAGWFEVT